MIDDRCSRCGGTRDFHDDHGHVFVRTLKVGDAVQTRDGRKARIVCDDLDGNHLGVLIASPRGEQFVVYKTHGRCWGGDTDSSENVNDLIPAPRKRTVWVNVYDSFISAYGSRKGADRDAVHGPERLARACIEIEEGRFDD